MRRGFLTWLALGLMTCAGMQMLGCKSDQATIIDGLTDEDVDRPLAPGEWGLVKLDPKDYPDMRSAFNDKEGLERAVDKSLQYMHAPSSHRFFPSGPITHSQVVASLEDIKKLLNTLPNGDAFQQQLLARYDVYESKGYNRKGDVWFTAYYTPIYYGSKVPTPEYRYPVYSRPNDLISDSVTGEIKGQRLPDGSMRPYPTRKEIVAGNLLRGLELAYFKDPLEPYIIQVQGSAKVIQPDGKELFIGYAGKNGGEYRGLGAELVKDGKIEKKKLSFPAVINYFKQHPAELNDYVMRNDSFAFLKEYDPKEWPSGSLGVQVTPQRSLATDKSIFQRAALTFITAEKPDQTGAVTPYRGFLLDQDTGGAIRAAGRADIYLGIGEKAGLDAGKVYNKGHLYYLFLKSGQFSETPVLTPVVPPANLGKETPKTPKITTTKPGVKPSNPATHTPMRPGDTEIFPNSNK